MNFYTDPMIVGPQEMSFLSGNTADVKCVEKAIKKDQDKAPIHLVPSQCIIGVAKVMGYGKDKYDEYNYRKGEGLDYMRLYDAAQRHMLAWSLGEDIDPESGLPHLDHAAASIMMLHDLQSRGGKNDNRPKLPNFFDNDMKDSGRSLQSCL